MDSVPEDLPTRTEIEEAIRHVQATMQRGPAVMRPRYHREIDRLLDKWVTAVLEESLADG